MRVRRARGGAWTMAGIGLLAAVWALAESPAGSMAPTRAAAMTNAAPTPQGLPEFREIVHDNKASVVNITMSGKQRIMAFNPFGNRGDEEDDDAGEGGDGRDSPFDQLPDNSPFRQFFHGFGQRQPSEREVRGSGSGFIISPDGKILTNAHVVDGADTVTVRLLDNTEYQAKVLGKDRQTDVALLKIDAKNLPVVKMGNSDELSVGEWVLAIGSPFGLDYSATQGIVSALGRSLPNETYVPFIQTDVAVNPGNSGGPLFNTRGEVVGINSQIYSNTGSFAGLSFAIPINTVRSTVAQLEKNGHVTRGWLGVQVQNVTSDLAASFGLDKPQGALVGDVDKDGPAGKAGLQSGDVVLSFNGQSLNDSADLPPLVGAMPAGSKVELKVLRDGHELTLHPVIGTLKDDDRQAGARDAEGKPGKAILNVSVQALTEKQRRQLEIASGGVLITQVNPGPAAHAGIEAGDVVLKVGGKAIDDPGQFVTVVRSLPRGKPVAFLIQRQQARVFVAVTLPKVANSGKESAGEHD
ncbi:MAG: DegQ family serine endoprotease [Steroidobacteraceae bacterium]